MYGNIMNGREAVEVTNLSGLHINETGAERYPDGLYEVKLSDGGFDLKVSCDSGEVYDVSVTEDREKTETGTYTARTVEVRLSGEELYTLKTGDYDRKNGKGKE